jgi:hypothetical protein
MHHHAQPIVKTRTYELFCLEYPQTVVLPISTSQVARIIGLNHHAQCLLHLDVETSMIWYAEKCDRWKK